MRKKFHQRDDKIDRAALEYLANIIKNEPQDYTDEEEDAIRKGKEVYEKCKKEENFDDLKSPDERVKMKLVHVDGASSGTAFANTIVDASVEECAAYEFYLDSINMLKQFFYHILTEKCCYLCFILNILFHYISYRKLNNDYPRR